MSIHRRFYLYALSLALPILASPAQAHDLRPPGEGASPDIVLVHGDYDWINKGRYTNQRGEHCCGRDDCYEVSPERVQQNTEGYSLPDHNLTVPGRLAIPSEDGKYWLCKVGARMRCFFAPMNGF